MNPSITQAIAAEKIKDMHALAAAERRVRQVRRPRRGPRAGSSMWVVRGWRSVRPVPPQAA
jgi:hypothetical protein